MADDFIYPHEFAILVVWLSAPTAIIVIAVLSWFFARRGFFQPGRRAGTALRMAVAVVGTIILSVPLWVVLPTSLLPPEIGGSPVPPLFLPSLIAALVVVPLVFWWAVRSAGRHVKSHVPSA